MKIKIMAAVVVASTLALAAAPVASAASAVDPVQEHNISKCYFDKSASGKEKEKYCKKLEGKQLTAKDKECLKRAGIAGAAALTLGRINNKKAKEITANATVGALAACFSAKIK
ncbi:hypothetical protein AB0C81_18290 [Streptomyces roseoverticillatus]|uniref:hypothetical protein n=1 Tax=Streptomyces roseoverticillatus TaxID=66429 RepID=UPI0033ECAE0B